MEPVLINSALVSAQNRQRLYWVGRRNPNGTYSQVPVEQPEDRGILLWDILETSTSEKGYALDPTHAEVLNVNPSGHGMNGAVIHCDGKSRTLTTNKGEGPKIMTPIRIGTIRPPCDCVFLTRRSAACSVLRREQFRLSFRG